MNATWLAAAQPAAASSFLSQMILMTMIFGIFYVIWFLPLRKKQKALDQLLEALGKGDKVVTNSGFYGEVVKVEGHKVLLKLGENVKVWVAKHAIAGLEGQAAERGQ